MSTAARKPLEWTESARAGLADGIAYIAQDNAAAALGVWERIEGAASLLVEQPRIGRPGALLGTREFSVARTSYTLIYHETAHKIQILHVIHQRREQRQGLKLN